MNQVFEIHPLKKMSFKEGKEKKAISQEHHANCC